MKTRGIKLRVPRKMKKFLKKNGAYVNGFSLWHCAMCQKNWACCGYDLLFCDKCDGKLAQTLNDKP